MTQDIRARLLQFNSQPVAHETAEFGTVYLRRLTLGELDQIQAEGKKTPKSGEVQIPTTVRLLARFLGDESGATVFDLTKPADRDVLMAVPVSLAAELLRAGNKINNMEETKEGEAKND
jgi:hypothetical protein